MTEGRIWRIGGGGGVTAFTETYCCNSQSLSHSKGSLFHMKHVFVQYPFHIFYFHSVIVNFAFMRRTIKV